MRATAARSSSEACAHQTASGSVSWVPELATEQRRVVHRIAERLAGRVPLPLPARHAETGDLESRERRADEVRHGAEVLGDDLRAGLTEDGEHLLSERGLLRLVGRREERLAAGARPAVGAIEADEMIDTVAVEQLRTAARAIAQPAELVGAHRVPAVDRHPPVLAAGTEGIRRHADRRVEEEPLADAPRHRRCRRRP